MEQSTTAHGLEPWDYSQDMRQIENFINNERVAGLSDARMLIINPVTGSAYAEAAVSGPKDVDKAMSAAAKAFEQWRT